MPQISRNKFRQFLSAGLLCATVVLLMFGVLPAVGADTADSDAMWQQAQDPRPLLAGIHPAILAAFQLLASLTALVAFSPDD